MFGLLRRHRLVTAGALVVLAAMGAFVILYFAPQQLFINTRVDEPIPTSVARASAPTTGAVATGPMTLRSGMFRSLEHNTSGSALLLLLPDGSTVLRLENFATSNGPDVHVYLSAALADGPPDALGRNPIELGGLKANQGNVNYSVPEGIDVSQLRSAVIWCRRFSVGFGVAPLSPV